MRKIIFIITLITLFILIVCITYLSIYGVKTENFNSFLNNQVKEYNSRLTTELNDVYIKLNLSKGSINLITDDSILISENNKVKIDNIDINLNIMKFIRKENSIKNIKIVSSENSIKSLTSILNMINFDLSRYILYNQIKEGFIKFDLAAEFDTTDKKISSYLFSGSIKGAKFNLLGKDSFKGITFNFNSRDNQTDISNLKFVYQNLNFFSENIKIENKKSEMYYVKGDIENSKTFIDPNVLFELANIKQDFLSNREVLLQTKSFFSFRVNKNMKLRNIKFDSILNFDEIYLKDSFPNLIFLKNGTINYKYENKEATADVVSNFVFSENMKLKNSYENNFFNLSLKRKKNNDIKINGHISNEKTYLDPKIILNLLKLNYDFLSGEKVNIATDNEFKFEINNSKIKNYRINSTIDIDNLKFNRKIQNIFYLKNIKTKLTFEDDLLNIDLKSNYSFNNKKYNNKLDNNIFYLKLENNNSNISDVEILLDTNKNKINTKEFTKYLNINESFVDDQTINLDSNFKINFSIDNLFNVSELTVQSDLNIDKLDIDYESNLIKKYLVNYANRVTIRNTNILFEYSNNKMNLTLDGKYLLRNEEDKFFVKLIGNKGNFQLYSNIDFNKSSLNFRDIQYIKKKNVPSKLEILINNSKESLNIEKIIFIEKVNRISIKNLNITENLKIKSVDEIDINFLNENEVLNNFKIKRNLNNYNIIGKQIDGEKLVEILLKSNDKYKISKFFYNINASLKLEIDKLYLKKNSYLNEIFGEFEIKNNKLILGKINAFLNNKKKFSYSLRSTVKNEKITNIFIEEPKPFINNYKFIKGFEEGELKLNSIKIDNTSRSNLKITNFKIKEVPVLAKILTLASLQGIADLLTGEGIRFNKFEMNFTTKNKLTEIEEMYAIGPAISIMMEGYVETDKVTSLRGTLVPATTINKTISKIPLLGDILVGNKMGEGIFGVSFKIKGQPDNLKSTVNPIKTLTPRFITRTLENLKGN